MKGFRGLEDRCTRRSKSGLLATSGLEPLAAVTVSTENCTTPDLEIATTKGTWFVY